MTVLEQHIEIDLYVQQMNSAAYRKISPQEKDRVLNNMVDKFIDGVFDERADAKQIGFQGNSRRLVDIKDLLVKGKKVPLYNYPDEELVSYAILPADFHYPNNGKIRTYCPPYHAVPEIEKAVEWKAVMKFPVETRTERFYETLEIRYNSTVLFKTEDYPALAEGLPDLDEKFALLDLVLATLNRNSKFEVYWEEYGDDYQPNSAIFISGEQLQGLHEIVVVMNGEETYYPFKAIEREKLKVTTKDVKADAGMRLTRVEDLYDVLDHSLSRTKHESPVTVITGNKLLVYRDKEFKADYAYLDYIRKPRKINLALGHDCEIRSESAQRRITEMAGKHILRNLESGAYQSAIQENIISQ